MSDIDLKALADTFDAAAQALGAEENIHAMRAGLVVSFHKRTKEELLDRLESAERRAEEAEKECAEQARLVGMGAERELGLMAKLGQAEKERDAQKEISRGLVGYMGMIEGTLSVPSDYPLTDLLVHLDELRNDAERYRWLRDNNGCDTELAAEVFIGDEAHGPGHLDAQVDAAMAQEGGK